MSARFILLLLVAACSYLSGYAQNSNDTLLDNHDTLSVPLLVYDYEGMELTKEEILRPWGREVQIFDTAEALDALIVSPSNIAAAPIHLLPYYQNGVAPGLRLGYGLAWQPYGWISNAPELTYSSRPYTNIKYIQGARGLQQFNLFHSQPILPYWNITAKATRFVSNGYLDNDTARQTHVNLTSWYQSKNRRYSAGGGLLLHNYSQAQNAGVVQSELYKTDTISTAQRRSLETPLTRASSRYRSSSFFLKQSIRLGRKSYLAANDTLQTDSSSADSFALVESGYKLNYVVRYDRELYSYLDYDVNKEYYPIVYGDDTTDFSVQLQTLHNEASLTRTFSDDSGFSMKYFRAAVVDEGYFAYDSFFLSTGEAESNSWVQGEVSLGSYRISTTGSALYTLAGANQGDYNLSASAHVGFLPQNKLLLVGSGLLQRFSPSIMEGFINNNHIQRNHNFAPSTLATAEVAIVYTAPSYSTTLSLKQSTIKEMILYQYFDLPFQSQLAVNWQQVGWALQAKYSIFQYEHNITLFNTAEALLALPDLSYRGGVSARFPLFKKALYLQPGMYLRTVTPYNAHAWNPVLAVEEYPQFNNKISYTVADVYVAAQVKRFFAFLKLHNVLQPLTGYSSFVTPAIPVYPTSFTFGVEWGLLN